MHTSQSSQAGLPFIDVQITACPNISLRYINLDENLYKIISQSWCSFKEEKGKKLTIFYQYENISDLILSCQNYWNGLDFFSSGTNLNFKNVERYRKESLFSCQHFSPLQMNEYICERIHTRKNNHQKEQKRGLGPEVVCWKNGNWWVLFV